MAKFGFDTMTLNDDHDVMKTTKDPHPHHAQRLAVMNDHDDKKFELAVYELSRIVEMKEAEVPKPAPAKQAPLPRIAE